MNVKPDQTQQADTQGQRQTPASVVSWVALAIAILVAGYVVRDQFELSMLRPGGDTAGLPEIGQPAPDFAAMNVDGDAIALSDFAGQPVWLNFWGAWCPPCRAEIPDMIQTYAQVRDDDVILMAVSLEEPSHEAFDYAERAGMDFTVLSDPNREAIRGKYRVRSFPTHVFIDSDGIVREIVTTTMSTQTALNHLKDLN